MSKSTQNTNIQVTKNVIQYLCICNWCGKNYRSRSHLKSHVKKLHNIDINHKSPTLKCPLCSNKLATYEELDTELSINHNIVIERLRKNFDSLQAFEQWKIEFEEGTQSSFVKQNARLTNNKLITKYVCNRSGFYVPKLKDSVRKREVKAKGSNKIESHCPARLTSTKEESGCILLEYVPTHVGHELEVGRLRLTKEQRNKIAGKLIQGIPSQRILQDIGKTFDSSKRLSLTTKQDIYNVKKSFNVQSDVIFHSEDAMSVDILIEKMKSAVLAYKPYGAEDSVISKNYFFLVFMNSAQKEMLVKYGNNILMIDSTHGTNPYNIQLTTLMVLDEDYEGFPVAFLWSIAQNEQIFEKFFSCIKKQLPELQPKTFLSDDANAFYNAFTKTYQRVPNKILCDWHVKKNLNENLSKISSLEKRKEVNKTIKLLIHELDVITFEIMLPSAIQKLLKDPDTKRYGEYFETYYSKRPAQWAHCYRKGVGRNTNMSLEKWHQELKHNPTVGGKCQQRLDVSINNVLECLRFKFMRRLVSISRNKVPRKLTELRRRHKLAQQFVEFTNIYEDDQNLTWLISSSKNKEENSLLEYYTVKKEANIKCGCNFVCNDCRICLHTYSCTCHDYSVQFNMCKHIHMVCMKFPKTDTESLTKTIQSQEHIEQNAICCHLQNKANTESLRKEKDIVMEKLNNIVAHIENSNSLESILYASTNLSTIVSGLTALSTDKEKVVHIPQPAVHVPSNKKIKQQKRLLPPKKTKNKRKKLEFENNQDNILSLNLIM